MMSYGSLTYVCVCCRHTNMQKNKDWILHSPVFSLCVSLPPIFPSVSFNSADKSISLIAPVSSLYVPSPILCFSLRFPSTFGEVMGSRLNGKISQMTLTLFLPFFSLFLV